MNKLIRRHIILYILTFLFASLGCSDSGRSTKSSSEDSSTSGTGSSDGDSSAAGYDTERKDSSVSSTDVSNADSSLSPQDSSNQDTSSPPALDSASTEDTSDKTVSGSSDPQETDGGAGTDSPTGASDSGGTPDPGTGSITETDNSGDIPTDNTGIGTEPAANTDNTGIETEPAADTDNTGIGTEPAADTDNTGIGTEPAADTDNTGIDTGPVAGADTSADATDTSQSTEPAAQDSDAAVCIDNLYQEGAVPCGLNDRGVYLQICTEGAWVYTAECTDTDICVDSDTQIITDDCGFNTRGEQLQRCTTGIWTDESCSDPDECGDAAFDIENCGYNDRGIRVYRDCVAGTWEWDTSTEGCTDPDVCADADFDTENCGINNRGVRVYRECDTGAWQWDTSTEGCTDPDVCADTDFDTENCGINNRGVRVYRECDTGAWQWDTGTEGCLDTDECMDTDWQLLLLSCGINRRGTQYQNCDVGVWVDDYCVDSDECTDNSTRLDSDPCGVNNTGDFYQLCETGQWVDDYCDDPNVCSDTSVDCGEPNGSCAYDTDSTAYVYTCNCNTGYHNSDTADLSTPCVDIPCYATTAGNGCPPNEHCIGTGINDSCDCDLGYLRDTDPAGDSDCTICDYDGAGYDTDTSGGCVAIPSPGQADLIITEVMIDPNGVDEYFEVVNVSGTLLNLAEMEIYMNDSPALTFPAQPAVFVAPGEYFVISASDGWDLSGNIVDYVLPGFYTFIPNEGGISLMSAAGNIDAVVWDSINYAQENGASLSLSPDVILDADAATFNNLPGYWCPTPGISISGYADKGTPGTPNEACNTLNCGIAEPQSTVFDATYTDTAGTVTSQSGELNAQVYHALYTTQAGNQGVITAELGYGARYTNPEEWSTWQPATYTGDGGAGQYDIFTSELFNVPEGVYYFAFRVSVDSGVTWRYCDTTWTDPYDGYDLAEGGVMSVTNYTCVPGVNECQDCIDNDGNGFVDGMDIKCLFSLDTTENKLRTEISGDETTAIGASYDCFVDGNSGEGDDLCAQNSCCNLHDPDIDDFIDLNLADDYPGLPNCPSDCPARCGDDLCSISESHVYCPEDCTQLCGNDICDSDIETAANCPADCPAACPDGMCTHNETYLTCSDDCAPLCGNDICELGHPNCEGFTSPNNKGIILADECRTIDNKYQPITGCGKECAPFVPSGCDCWGCCTICVDNVCENIFTDPHANYWSDVSDPVVACNESTFDDPAKCMRCEQAAESARDCASECAAECGDGYCTHNEQGADTADTDYCDADCGPTCGNAVCDTDSGVESVANCPVDCPTASCGDGFCSPGEEDSGCDDCSPGCGDGACGLVCGTMCDPENCIICPGMTADDLPAHCVDSGGAACPNNWTVCASSADCPNSGFYCVSGCCVPNS